ncbi:Protein DD3-3 [Symbiodinium microadriaticum]|uniref:Protein DD3-3 n=1 Tax=Symbiodinium microadriaticum TaxID=2951 RepID=A0A1Q9C8A7_SYMMI|nr:Protein DD3-3 [Symbiodinium microadriaticum]
MNIVDLRLGLRLKKTSDVNPEATPGDMARTMRCCLLFVAFCRCAVGDVYLHNPRGSNNKLSEQQNNAQNQNRLFDSQNNAQGGYQIGDNCQNACQDENRDYDATKSGAMKGHMTYYQGSELYIEWERARTSFQIKLFA